MTFAEEVATRREMVMRTHPLMGKEIKAKRVLVPADQAIAQLMEAKEMYEMRIAEIDAELSILRDR